VTAGGKLTRTAGPSVQRPEQSDTKVTSATELAGCTGKSCTSGWAGSNVVLALAALLLLPFKEGLFCTFRAADFAAALPVAFPMASLRRLTDHYLKLKNCAVMTVLVSP